MKQGVQQGRSWWRQIIGEQQASGKKVSAFCNERGLQPWKFWYWRKALMTDSAKVEPFAYLFVH